MSTPPTSQAPRRALQFARSKALPLPDQLVEMVNNPGSLVQRSDGQGKVHLPGTSHGPQRPAPFAGEPEELLSKVCPACAATFLTDDTFLLTAVEIHDRFEAIAFACGRAELAEEFPFNETTGLVPAPSSFAHVRRIAELVEELAPKSDSEIRWADGATTVSRTLTELHADESEWTRSALDNVTLLARAVIQVEESVPSRFKPAFFHACLSARGAVHDLNPGDRESLWATWFNVFENDPRGIKLTDEMIDKLTFADIFEAMADTADIESLTRVALPKLIHLLGVELRRTWKDATLEVLKTLTSDSEPDAAPIVVVLHSGAWLPAMSLPAGPRRWKSDLWSPVPATQHAHIGPKADIAVIPGRMAQWAMASPDVHVLGPLPEPREFWDLFSTMITSDAAYVSLNRDETSERATAAHLAAIAALK